ncbi:unnamed protein product [Merluccius merluccius]
MLVSHIQSVLADAQAMVKEDDTVVGAVQRTTFRGGGRHQPAQFQHKEFRSAPKQSESSYPSAGKKCYRCVILPLLIQAHHLRCMSQCRLHYLVLSCHHVDMFVSQHGTGTM